MRIILASIIMSLGSLLAAQNASAIVKWDHETIDLGGVKKGDLVRNVFSFTNTSNVAVEIDVVSTCECTEAKWTLGEIPPGEKGGIQFTFDTTKKDVVEPIDVDVYFINTDADGNPYSSFLSYTFSFMN